MIIYGSYFCLFICIYKYQNIFFVYSETVERNSKSSLTISREETHQVLILMLFKRHVLYINHVQPIQLIVIFLLNVSQHNNSSQTVLNVWIKLSVIFNISGNKIVTFIYVYICKLKINITNIVFLFFFRGEVTKRGDIFQKDNSECLRIWCHVSYKYESVYHWLFIILI